MRSGIFVAPFGELADPRLLAELAARAEARGWDGFFLWDHVLYAEPVREILDPWVSLAAIACATERVSIGALVTPIARRRPHKLAREIATLDLLSGGRVVVGLGLGPDATGEFARFGDETDPRARGRMLDEGAALLDALLRGEAVRHHGETYTADDVTLLPRGVQRPRPPIWLAARWPNRRPVRRAARYDGLFPIELESPDQLAEMIADVDELRERADAPFDVAVTGSPGEDATPWREAGATWWLAGFDSQPTRAAVEAAIDAGPPPSG